MPRMATAALIAPACAFLLTAPTELAAKVKFPVGKHYSNFHPYPQSYDGNEPAELYPNCLPWSPKLKTWVWICGPPYPPGYPVQR
jgi:hypothetical protein